MFAAISSDIGDVALGRGAAGGGEGEEDRAEARGSERR